MGVAEQAKIQHRALLPHPADTEQHYHATVVVCPLGECSLSLMFSHQTVNVTLQQNLKLEEATKLERFHCGFVTTVDPFDIAQVVVSLLTEVTIVSYIFFKQHGNVKLIALRKGNSSFCDN